jgi:hypothetical protein
MRNGVVLAYSKDVTTGIIQSLDGTRVFFSDRNWKSVTAPRQGLVVRFGDAPNGTLHVFSENDVSVRA